jgi:hypothetical protein
MKKKKSQAGAKVFNLEAATIVAISYMLIVTYPGAKQEYARLVASKDKHSKRRLKSFRISGQFLLDRLKEAVELDGVRC